MEDLYSKDDLYYNKYTDKLFSGSIEDENTTGIIEDGLRHGEWREFENDELC